MYTRGRQQWRADPSEQNRSRQQRETLLAQNRRLRREKRRLTRRLLSATYEKSVLQRRLVDLERCCLDKIRGYEGLIKILQGQMDECRDFSARCLSVVRGVSSALNLGSKKQGTESEISEPRVKVEES